ncbi:MAG: 50S ribosomal protein L21 [Proteobacteria bacterium]|nr:50S ribosomal protein L21 [Pseudomonadota bacterium]
MFAVIRTGGKQFKVVPDEVIVVERLAGESGASVELGDVLMVGDGATTTVGKPVVDGARVAAEIVAQSRGDKITVLKFRRRQKYRRTLGHQQDQTVLRITEISAPGMKTATAAPAKSATKAAAKSGETDASASPATEKKSAATAPGTKKAATKKAATKAATGKKPATRKTAAKKLPAKSAKKES